MAAAIVNKNGAKSRTSAAIIQLFESIYTQGVALPANYEYYSELMDVLDKEDVNLQLYQLLNASGRITETPTHFQKYLCERRDRVLAQNLYIMRETERILRAFDEVEITATWLKGPLFAEEFFGHFGARSTSDIDLLVPLDRVKRAQEVLIGLGYAGPYGKPNHYHIEFVKETNNPTAPLVVELHVDLVKPGTTNLDLSAFWENASLRPGYRFIKELSEQHTFYAMCIHAANHALNHLKHRLDIIHLLCRENSCINLEHLASQAQSDECMGLVGMVLTSIYDEFRFLDEICPLPNGFRVRKTRRQFRLYLNYNLATIDGWKRKMRFLIRWLFPPKTEANYMTKMDASEGKSLVGLYIKLYILRFNQFTKRRMESDV